MAHEKMKIAIFKPYNARLNNAFGSGQYPVFKKLQDNGLFDVTFFLDNKNVVFNGVGNRYIKNNKFITLFNRIVKKLFKIKYIKIPYYGNIDFNKYDIIVTEGFHYSFLKYFFDYKGILVINDSITVEEKISKLNFNLINTKFKNAYVVVVNEKLKLLFEKYGLKLNIEVIGHALQTDKINFKERKKFNGKILSIGRLVYEKGYKYIFRAIKILIEKYPYITLDIYGDGPLKIDLENYIKSNSLEKNIFLKGSLNHDDLINRLNEYDLFMSHPLETYYIAEAFHMGNMEAMANGLPVITTNCGGVPYVVKDKAIVNKQKDVNAIIESVEKLINDNKLYNQMSIEGRKFVEDNYSLNVIYNKFNKYLQRRYK